MEGFNHSPAKSAFEEPLSAGKDENAHAYLRPMIPTITTTTLPLAEQDTNSFNSPMSMESTGSRNSMLMVEDPHGAFNFQPGLMSKGPVAKAVSMRPLRSAQKESRYRCTDFQITEHRATARSQIQAL